MRRLLLCGLVTALAQASCGMGSSDAAAFGEERAGEPNAGPSNGAAGPAGADGPAEKEIESDYEAPVATGKLVWITNPKSGRVALVDAASLQVRTVEAGNGPTYLAAVPGQAEDTTLVLNVLSEDATLLRAGTQITTKTLKVAKQANSMAFSADGRYAIAWADAKKIKTTPPKTQGFQDITVLDLVNGTSTILAVGYRPVLVGFAANAPRAYAVTQDGVAIVDVPNATLTKNVLISDTPTEDPGTRDVFVTKDGNNAYIRRDNSNVITIVSLENDTRGAITLSSPVTDMDLADTGDRAVAVARQSAQVAVIPIANPAAFQSVTITGETIGSVAIAPGGKKGLLYTNATAAERFTILNIGAQTDPYRIVRLYSPVLGIFPTPSAQHAVVVHDKTAGEGGSPGAFSLVPIDATLPAKIVATEAPPTAVSAQNDRAVIAERDDKAKKYGAYLARFPQLMVERYPLASPPISVGVVAGAKRAYVAQAHPEGRLTFIDLESGVARTLTGFELSSRVVDGSKP